jgi:hypothetical protein
MLNGTRNNLASMCDPAIMDRLLFCVQYASALFCNYRHLIPHLMHLVIVTHYSTYYIAHCSTHTQKLGIFTYEPKCWDLCGTTHHIKQLPYNGLI